MSNRPMPLPRIFARLTAASSIILAAALSSTPLRSAEPALHGAEPGKWTMDYDAALQAAREKNLPILLNFTGSDWCVWCIHMDKNVFAQPAWHDYAAKNLFLVTLDFPQNATRVPPEYAARNARLQRQFSVQGYPTYVVLDSDGKTELGRLGASRDASPQSFISELEQVLALSQAKVAEKAKALGPVQGEKYRAAVAAAREAREDLQKWLDTRPPRTPANEKTFQRLKEKIEEAEKALESF